MLLLQITVKFFIDIMDVNDAVSKYQQLASLLQPNRWFKFVDGKVTEDPLTYRIFLSFNITNDEDLANFLRK